MLIKFLSQSGPRAHKHSSSWLHPLSTLLVHYLISTALIILVHDHVFGTEKKNQLSIQEEEKRSQIAQYTFFYFVFLFLYRFIQQKGNDIFQKTVLYEHTWLCNSTLFMGALGLWTDRDILVLAHVVAVSIDQVLWYVDLSGWTLSGFKKFPIGVAKYITWKQTSWATRITCTHHLWTIPVLIGACNGIKFPIETYLFSGYIIVLNVSMSRWLTPFVIEAKSTSSSTSSSKDDDGKHEVVKYLNVNLSHELWKDITFEILQIQYDNPPTVVYLFRLLWRWQVFNGIVFFAILCPLSNFFFPNK